MKTHTYKNLGTAMLAREMVAIQATWAIQGRGWKGAGEVATARFAYTGNEVVSTLEIVDNKGTTVYFGHPSNTDIKMPLNLDWEGSAL